MFIVNVFLPAFLCGDGFLRPTRLPWTPPRNGFLRWGLLVALVRRRVPERPMPRTKVGGRCSNVVVDVRRGIFGSAL